MHEIYTASSQGKYHVHSFCYVFLHKFHRFFLQKNAIRTLLTVPLYLTQTTKCFTPQHFLCKNCTGIFFNNIEQVQNFAQKYAKRITSFSNGDFLVPKKTILRSKFSLAFVSCIFLSKLLTLTLTNILISFPLRLLGRMLIHNCIPKNCSPPFFHRVFFPTI